ncbi:hypothetical protein LINPERPRIM_LOCUS38198 [Linum perenne]
MSAPSSARFWASTVSQSEDDLQFVEAYLRAVVDGVLKIPMAFVDKGVAKLRSAMVGKFVGDEPPIKVIQSVVN